MTPLSFRASLSLLAATLFFFGPGRSSVTAQGIDCASTTCPPLTNCTGCPNATPLTVSSQIRPRELGPRFNSISVDTFPDTGPGGLGTLQRAELTITIQPGECYYRVENLGTTSCSALAQAPGYDVTGYLDVGDPTQPGNLFLVTTSDKVDGWPLSTNCLEWRVDNRNLPATFGIPALPPWDQCYDFNDPTQAPLTHPNNLPNQCSIAAPHGGPCDTLPTDVPGVTCCPNTALGGTRVQFGRSVVNDNSVPGCPTAGIPNDAFRSGYTDRRNFTSADAYRKTICITDSTRLNFFRRSIAGTVTVGIPLKTEARLVFPSWSCSNLDQEELITIGVRVDIKYYYCPTPPVCQPDTANVCRNLSSTTVVNVLANDTPPPGAGPIGGLNCGALTGTNNLTQGTYGSTQWVDDASAVNTACRGRGIRYTLTSLPPVGTTTDTFSYTIVGNNGCTSTCTVTVTIASPVCAPDTADICRTAGASVDVNVLANDTSLRPLNCALLTGTTGLTNGTYGTVQWLAGSCTNTLCTGRCVRYTLNTLPPAGTNTDTFSYTITDTNGCTSTCTVTVTIASPACQPDTANLCRTAGTSVDVNVLANDTSLRPLNCGILTGSTGITNGTYVGGSWVAGACTNTLCTGRCVRYTLNTLPPAGTNTDTFSYTITDTNGCTSTCTVTVTIASPACQPDTANLCRTAGTSVDVNVLANDTSLRPLNCGILTGSTGITNGTYVGGSWVAGACTNTLCTGKCLRLTLNTLPPVGTTTDTVSYTITDTNGCTSTCTVTVTIASPVCAPDTADICRTAGTSVDVNVLANDTSLRPLNCALLTGTTGLTNGTYGTVQWSAGSCTNTLCTGRCVRYTLNTLPPAGTNTDTFSYTITDTNGCTSTCTVTVTIASPVCQPDCTDVCATVGATATVNVLANDASPRPLNCGLLTGTGGLTQGTYGTTEWIAGACANTLCTGKCVRYTVTAIPPAGVTQDTFNYTITDTNGCTSTCQVVVKFCKIDAVDDGPFTGCAEKPLRICVLDNDTSTCGTLGCSSLSIVTQPANGIVQIVQDCSGLPSDCCHTALPGCTGCCLVYTPNTGFYGTETFTYRISATSTGCPGGTPINCTDTATVTVRIKPAPTAIDDTYSLSAGGTAGPFDVRVNDSPGIGCETVGCGAPCAFVGCPVILQQPLYGTVTIGADCRITYTANPAIPFPGTDTFTYCVRNNCDCCDEARVTITECPCVNRLLPGSLLIYPEYDNRQGRTTYISITNSSCKWPNAGTWVEFVYINKDNCIETNRSTFLTPCDTYTVLSASHNPNQTRGYMYAFAKDAQNRPISFNHLIGDLLIADGIDGYQYAVNPVSFRSPLPQGQLTDVDNDGIHDLNGIEYDPAPDIILIPRFLGQDPLTQVPYQDELVLLNLSGGLSFQTVISIIGYNDNEVPFSATKQFYCWEKFKLLEISGAFANTYLDNLGDDPLEIIGNPAREAGWFKIDGATAFSDIEQITDPAIYAFLVERATNPDRGAELPWELCVQNNGDLLPKNPLGDGPIPVNGDNQ